MWGDGEQTRSFCYIDDCVEGILRIMQSDYEKPLNLGSDHLISMNDFIRLVATFEDKNLAIKHIEGPQGVRGRNSDNTRIREILKWSPEIPLSVGMKVQYDYIKKEMLKDTTVDHSHSVVVGVAADFDDFVALEGASNKA